ERDRAAGDRQQARNTIERRGLAATRGPEQADELAAPDDQRQLMQCGDALPARIVEMARDLREAQLFEIRVHRNTAAARHIVPRCMVTLLRLRRADLLVPD